jgi:hypothetical protein
MTSHRVVLSLAVLAALLAIGGCGASVTKPSAPAATAPTTAAPTAAAPSPTPSPANSLSGPVGTVYQAGDGNGNKMSVKLTRVIDPAQGADQFTTPDNRRQCADLARRNRADPC